MMFGNEFIDYCAVHYDELVKISNSQFDELIMNHLSDNAKVFIRFYRQLQENIGKDILVETFITMGIDFTRLCLLIFLVFSREGNTSIRLAPDLLSVIYRPL